MYLFYQNIIYFYVLLYNIYANEKGEVCERY